MFFDEINMASEEMQKAVQHFVLTGKIGKRYTKPAGVKIVAAGNREEDNAMVIPLPSPLASRFDHVEILPDVDVWVEYEVSQGLNPDVLGFIQFRRDLLYKPMDTVAFPNPRAWERAAKRISNLEENSIESAMAMSVGTAAANEFYLWRKLYRDVRVNEIFNGRFPDLSNSDESLKYAIVTAIAGYLKDKTISNKQIGNLSNFLLNHLPTEYHAVLFRLIPANRVMKILTAPEMQTVASRLASKLVQ